MATIIGNNGDVTVGANVVAEVVSFSLSETTNVADDTVLGDAYQSHIAGTKAWSGSVSCYRDKTDSTGQGALVNGASVVLHLREEGAGSGNIDRTGTVTITGIESNNANDATVPINFTFTGNGAVAENTL